jgi:hypothetical protein
MEYYWGIIDLGVEENLISRDVIAGYEGWYYFDDGPRLVSINDEPISSYSSCLIFVKIIDLCGIMYI